MLNPSTTWLYFGVGGWLYPLWVHLNMAAEPNCPSSGKLLCLCCSRHFYQACWLLKCSATQHCLLKRSMPLCATSTWETTFSCPMWISESPFWTPHCQVLPARGVDDWQRYFQEPSGHFLVTLWINTSRASVSSLSNFKTNKTKKIRKKEGKEGIKNNKSYNREMQYTIFPQFLFYFLSLVPHPSYRKV